MVESLLALRAPRVELLRLSRDPQPVVHALWDVLVQYDADYKRTQHISSVDGTEFYCGGILFKI